MNKKLRKSYNDKKIAGICGGLAEYFEIDSTIIRVIFLAAALFGGGGVLLYLLFWLIMPN